MTPTTRPIDRVNPVQKDHPERAARPSTATTSGVPGDRAYREGLPGLLGQEAVASEGERRRRRQRHGAAARGLVDAHLTGPGVGMHVRSRRSAMVALVNGLGRDDAAVVLVMSVIAAM